MPSPRSSAMRGVEVVDQQGEVLAVVVGHGRLDEVDLLAADVEPRAAEAEVGPVGALHGAEHVDVEPRAASTSSTLMDTWWRPSARIALDSRAGSVACGERC